MRQVGMSDTQIRLVESTGKPQARITLTAPIGGVVTELLAREGMTVMAGSTLVRINGLGTVWANAEVPESQAARLRPGAKVRVRSPAVPGASFEGKVQVLLPEVNPATRTLKARLELTNPGNRLVPGMSVTMDFMDTQPEAALLVPSDAVIQTGKRAVVMLAEDNGHFRPVEVHTGVESGGRIEVKRGLQAGQRVVVSSQFLIDSEASLRGLEARLNDAPVAQAAVAPRFDGEGKVEAVGPDALTISHGPIPALKWGAMTMDFKLPLRGLPRNLQVGDAIGFEFTMGSDGLPQLTSVRPLEPKPLRAPVERVDDRAPDPLVHRQPLPGAAGHAGRQRLGRLLAAQDTAGRLARPVRCAGHHPHDLSRPGPAHRREPGHLPADHHHAVGAGCQDGARLPSSATRLSTCCSRTAPTCTGPARACWST
jgi:Cu(I)/Ag(I) efflux system membrane fusion protein